MTAVNFHYVLVDLFPVADLVRAECALERSTSTGYKAFKNLARWFAVLIVLAKDVAQAVQRGGTVAILDIIVRWG